VLFRILDNHQSKFNRNIILAVVVPLGNNANINNISGPYQRQHNEEDEPRVIGTHNLETCLREI